MSAVTTAAMLLLPLLLLAVLGRAAALDPELQGLKLVHLLYRHGDRSPINPYPTDPYRDPSYWPAGWGQLTTRGMARHFRQGQWLRDRYSGWLAANYSRAEIVVRSTDVDRTLMSAQSQLAGLFPPSGSQVFDPSLPWQPIPVHTVPQEQDYLLSSHAHCPRFEELQAAIETGEFMRGLYIENKELFQYISEHVGENITDIVKLDYVYDTLLIESENNFTLPAWTRSVFPGQQFKQLRDLSFTVDTLTQELKRLKGGPLVKEMLSHWDQLQAGTLDPEMKVFMYSGHDTTVAPLLHTLGVFNTIAPPYASLVLVELLDRGAGPLVKVSYRNDSSLPPFPLTLPGCDHLCPLEQFRQLTRPIVPGDILAECGLGSSNRAQKVTLVAALASTAMALTVLLATLCTVCRARRDSGAGPQARYSALGQNDI